MKIDVKNRAEAHRRAREYLAKERVLGDSAIDHAIVNGLLDALGFPSVQVASKSIAEDGDG